jgi:hypothetical protein
VEAAFYKGPYIDVWQQILKEKYVTSDEVFFVDIKMTRWPECGNVLQLSAR